MAAVVGTPASGSEVERPRWRWPAGFWELDGLLLLGLGTLALALRLPELQQIPPFTDELNNFREAALVARGRLWPLVDTPTSTYTGSLWTWLMAGALKLTNLSFAAPRTLVMAIGVLTVLATYLLGRAWGGRLGGLLAALLMATAANHIALNSHVAWSNCATPLFTTLAVWATWAASRRVGEWESGRVGEWEQETPSPQPSPRWRRGTAATIHSPILPVSHSPTLVVAGLLWGLAFQTHPSVLALLPGVALFLMWHDRSVLRSRRLYLAAGVFGLANLNLIIFNLLAGFNSVTDALGTSERYAGEARLSPTVYVQRLGALALGGLRTLSGAIDQRGAATDVLLDPGGWPIVAVAAAGLVWQWRRHNYLPALLLGSAVLILPLLNPRYEPIYMGRFLAPLLPVLFAGVGSLLAVMVGQLVRPTSRWSRAYGVSRWLLPAGFGLAVAFLVLHPLAYLQTYYEQVRRAGRTNAGVLETLEQIQAHRRGNELILIDQGLQGSGRTAMALRLALGFKDLAYDQVDLSTPALRDPSSRCRGQLVVLASRRAEENAALIAALDLRPLARPRSSGIGTEPVDGLYYRERLPDAPRRC